MSTTEAFASNAKQSSDKAPTENVSPLILILGICGLIPVVIVPLSVLVGSGSVVPLLCSAITIVWATWVTVWICKIKNRQTEAVQVQTEAVKVLEEILEETKAPRPRWLQTQAVKVLEEILEETKAQRRW
jgi:hypothetical protein